MKHLPVMTITNELDTPRLRILVRCVVCDVTVTDREVDLKADPSLLEAARTGNFSKLSDEEDSNAWLKHVRRSFND